MRTRRIFVCDKRTNISFLVDTGVGTCVYLRNKIFPAKKNRTNKSNYELFAANGTRTETYSTITISIDLSLQVGGFQVAFCSGRCANAYHPCRFHCGVLVDPRNKRILDMTTQLSTKGFAATADVAYIKTIDGDSPYHRLAEFPDLTRQPVFCRSFLNAKLRRLAPDQLKLAKAEFEVMIKQDVKPSRSPWASSLHIVPKKDGGIRPCGDYRALNARTTRDRYTPPHIEDFAQNLHDRSDREIRRSSNVSRSARERYRAARND